MAEAGRRSMTLLMAYAILCWAGWSSFFHKAFLAIAIGPSPLREQMMDTLREEKNLKVRSNLSLYYIIIIIGTLGNCDLNKYRIEYQNLLIMDNGFFCCLCSYVMFLWNLIQKGCFFYKARFSPIIIASASSVCSCFLFLSEVQEHGLTLVLLTKNYNI